MDACAVQPGAAASRQRDAAAQLAAATARPTRTARRSVSRARDIDVTMTSRLLMPLMLAALTSCTAEEYDNSGDDFGECSSLHVRLPVCLIISR